MSAIQRKAAVVGASLLVAALGWTAWQGARTANHRAGESIAVPRQAIPPAASTAAPLSQVAATAATYAPTHLVLPEQTSPLAPGDTEICGFGVAKNEADVKALEERAFKDVSTVLAAHAMRMVRSADARTRAVGLLLAGPHEALAGMAWKSADPLVYELALYACGFLQPPVRRHAFIEVAPSCAQLSVERAAALDPDNGQAWMRMANEAGWRGELDNQAYAYRRAIVAPEFRPRMQQSLIGITMAAVPQDASPSERLQVGVAVIAVQASMPIVYANLLQTYCAEARLHNANTRQECEALAEAMVRRSTSLFDLSMGRMLGRRLGWPAERLTALEAEGRLADAAWKPETSAPGGAMGCTGRHHAMRRWAAIAEHGERKAAQLLIASPPTSANR